MMDSTVLQKRLHRVLKDVAAAAPVVVDPVARMHFLKALDELEAALRRANTLHRSDSAAVKELKAVAEASGLAVAEEGDVPPELTREQLTARLDEVLAENTRLKALAAGLEHAAVVATDLGQSYKDEAAALREKV